MNWNEVLINSDVIAAIVGATLSFFLGIVASNFVNSRRKKEEIAELTFSKVEEETLQIAKNELKDKLKIFYLETEVETLYFFTLHILNTGKKTVKSQAFTCLFAEGTKVIDEAFPRVSTQPVREVGPVNLDETIANENEFRFTIDSIGVRQSVTIDFLTTGNSSNSFEVIFKPNDEQEVTFLEDFDLGHDLTQIQRDILKLLIDETMTSHSISDLLGISIQTLFRHAYHIYKIKGVSNRAELQARERTFNRTED